MIKKDVIYSFRPTAKNRCYFELLGIIDGRTGKRRKDGIELSTFVNQCITLALEHQMHPLAKKQGRLATDDEIHRAYIKMRIASNNKEQERLGKENLMLASELKTDLLKEL